MKDDGDDLSSIDWKCEPGTNTRQLSVKGGPGARTNEQQIASPKATESSKPRGPSYAWYIRRRATSDTRVYVSGRGLQTIIFTPALASVAKRIFWLGWTHF